MDFAAQDAVSSSTPPTDRAATGIEGLDDILSGGLPRQRMYLIQGEPKQLSHDFVIERE